MMMKHKITAVLFDLDGVVVFTDKYHFLGWQRLAAEQGWDFDEQVNHQLRGVSRMDSLRIILEHNGIELPESRMRALADLKNSYYVELLGGISESDMVPGARDFIAALKRRGAKLALCSASRNAALVVGKLGLGGLFDVVVTGGDVARSKPDPQIFLVAAEKLGVHPGHCLVVEDAVSGIEAGLRAGMKCIGFGPPERLTNAMECVTDYGRIDADALLETGHPRFPTADPWKLIEDEFNPRRAAYWESLFALSNGMMGLRGSHEEDDPVLSPHARPGFYINGIYDYGDYRHMIGYPGLPNGFHAMVNICDWRIVNVEVCGERFGFGSGKVESYRRELDMRRGILARSLVWESPSGRRVSMTSRRVVSMTDRSSAALRCEVEALNFTGDVVFESVVRGAAVSYNFGERRTKLVSSSGGAECAMFVARPSRADFRVVMAIGHRVDADAASEPAVTMEEDETVMRWTVQASPGRPVALEKHGVFAASEENPPDAAAVAERLSGAARERLARNVADGFETMAGRQARFWEEWWREGDIEIAGSDADQQAVRLSLFHLRQSHPESDGHSISATGMTSDGYNGHVFWDTEMYMAPYFNYVDPRLVRPLLMYRHGILDKARRQARLFECPGAMYSWTSINGDECGFVYEAASAQIHLNNAIAFAICRYWQAAADREFMFGPGAEILFETARFFAARGHFCDDTDGRFRIPVVCGPDEYGCNADNNYYTNLMTQWHLRFAAEIHETMRREEPARLAELAGRIGLDEPEVAEWRRAADRMHLPFNEQLGIHMQNDQFVFQTPYDMRRVPHYADYRWAHHPLNLWRYQVIKQADVLLATFVQSHRFTSDQKRRNYEYYEPKTNHGSSLSPAIHCIMAAELGNRAHMEQYLRDAIFMDLFDVKNNTGHGVHAACLGGTWMCIVNGLAGMRDEPRGLRFAPRIPAGWESYRFRLAWRGRRIEAVVTQKDATFRHVEGPALTFSIGEYQYRLSAGEETTCACMT